MSQKAEQKQRSHEAILASAAALLRRQGIKASSVMDVMSGAGLTVGGFYGHFDSKEHLFTETLRQAAGAMWEGLVRGARGDTPREKALSVMRRYLSRRHRDNAEAGCMLPSAVPEIAREGEPYRSALAQQLDGFVQALAALIGPGVRSRQKALGLIALMYGALSLSRAVAGTALSDQFLEAAKALGEKILTEEEAEAPVAHGGGEGPGSGGGGGGGAGGPGNP